jgi:hypothetical protein
MERSSMPGFVAVGSVVDESGATPGVTAPVSVNV